MTKTQDGRLSATEQQITYSTEMEKGKLRYGAIDNDNTMLKHMR